MLQHVNKVLVAASASAATEIGTGTYDALGDIATGEVALFDQNKEILLTTAAAAAAEEVSFGVVTGNTFSYVDPTGAAQTVREILYSDPINRDEITSNTFTAYSAPVEDIVTIDFTGVTVVASQRYVLRIIYKDLFEHPGQYTHTYEVIAAASGETVDTLAAAFAAKVNAHKGRRCIATLDAGNDQLILTAIAKDDNVGLESINAYTRVNMTAVMYTNTSTNYYSQIAALTIVKTVGTDGSGNPKIVRDREQAALAYKGITFRTTWAMPKQTLFTVLTDTYDTLTVESDAKYLSADNQYVKTTPLTLELYVKAGSYATSAVKDLFDAYVTATS